MKKGIPTYTRLRRPKFYRTLLASMGKWGPMDKLDVSAMSFASTYTKHKAKTKCEQTLTFREIRFKDHIAIRKEESKVGNTSVHTWLNKNISLFKSISNQD